MIAKSRNLVTGPHSMVGSVLLTHCGSDTKILTRTCMGLDLLDKRVVVEFLAMETLPDGSEVTCRPGDAIDRIDPRYLQPTKVGALLGDPSEAKAKQRHGLVAKIALPKLVKDIAESDCAAVRRYSLVKAADYQAYDHHE